MVIFFLKDMFIGIWKYNFIWKKDFYRYNLVMDFEMRLIMIRLDFKFNDKYFYMRREGERK